MKQYVEELELIMEAVKNGDTAYAEKEWGELIRENGELGTKAMIAILEQNPQMVEEWLTRMETRDPWLEAVRCILSLKQGRFEDARKHGANAISGGADSSIVTDALAAAAESLELYDEALDLQLRAMERKFTEERFMTVLSLLFRTGRLQEAEVLMDAMEQKKKEYSFASLRLLKACWKQEKEEAEKWLNRLDAEEDSVLKVYAELQAALLLKHDVSVMLDALREVQNLQTDLWVADALIQQNHFDAATAVLDQLCRREEKISAADILQIAGRYRMCSAYSRVCELLQNVNIRELPPKKRMLCHIEYAECLKQTGEQKKAFGLLQETLKEVNAILWEMPEESDLHLLRLRCYVGLDEKKKALEVAEFAKLISKDDSTRKLISALVQ